VGRPKRQVEFLLADVATGAVATADDPERGRVPGATAAVNVAGEPETWRDDFGTVTDALGDAPEWTDEPVSTGQMLSDRARGWAGRRKWASREPWRSSGRA
jgi:2-alkyl-3-oxoalkanoate reductase